MVKKRGGCCGFSSLVLTEWAISLQNSNSVSADGEDRKLHCRWLAISKVKINRDKVS